MPLEPIPGGSIGGDERHGVPFGARTRRWEMASEDRTRLGTSRWLLG
jgi:hypothetical protein